MGAVVKVVQPSGILDSIQGNQLRRDINDIVETKADIVLIDLQDISFVDSSGLSALISAQRMVRTAGAKLFLCSMNEQVQMLFELTKMSRVFDMLGDREEFEQKVLTVGE